MIDFIFGAALGYVFHAYLQPYALMAYVYFKPAAAPVVVVAPPAAPAAQPEEPKV